MKYISKETEAALFQEFQSGNESAGLTKSFINTFKPLC